MNVNDTWAAIEDLGRQRAAKSSELWDEHGITPEDSFVTSDGDMTIWNPWFSDCGRFEIDPYTTYGKPFVMWLVRPFYPETDDG